MRKKLIEENNAFPAFDIKSGKEIYIDCSDDLLIDVIHHADKPHKNGYNVIATVNQPSKNIIDAEMLLVSVDIDDWQ